MIGTSFTESYYGDLNHLAILLKVLTDECRGEMEGKFRGRCPFYIPVDLSHGIYLEYIKLIDGYSKWVSTSIHHLTVNYDDYLENGFRVSKIPDQLPHIEKYVFSTEQGDICFSLDLNTGLAVIFVNSKSLFDIALTNYLKSLSITDNNDLLFNEAGWMVIRNLEG